MQEAEANRKEIAAIMARLRRLRVNLAQDAAEAQKRSDQFNMVHRMTPAQEAEADRLADLLDVIENQIDAIDAALSSLGSI